MIFKKNQWLVKEIQMKTALDLIKKFHYCHGAAKIGVYTHGLFKKNKQKEKYCLGAILWIPPSITAAASVYPDFSAVLCLSRLVVAPEVPKNGASFLIASSMRLIDTERWHCLLTYADTWQNHSGQIYKATNWEYLGLTQPYMIYQNKEGLVRGKKRVCKNQKLTDNIDLESRGFVKQGKFPKHKYRYIFSKKN